MEVKSVAEQLYFTTVRIDTIDRKGETGSGTGFICVHDYRGNSYPFVVTNRHVVRNARKGGITFLKKENEGPKLGDAFRVENDNFPSLWHDHPDPAVDITIAPLAPIEQFVNDRGIAVFYRSINTDMIPRGEELAELDALEEIVFVGYPIGIWDQENFTPVMRKGTTATPICLNFEGQKKFLIDASVFVGSSGSPVFIYNRGAYATKTGEVKFGTRVLFVGVVTSVFHKDELNEIVRAPVPTEDTPVVVGKEMIDLGIVFRSETVVEAIESAIDRAG